MDTMERIYERLAANGWDIVENEGYFAEKIAYVGDAYCIDLAVVVRCEEVKGKICSYARMKYTDYDVHCYNREAAEYDLSGFHLNDESYCKEQAPFLLADVWNAIETLESEVARLAA